MSLCDTSRSKIKVDYQLSLYDKCVYRTGLIRIYSCIIVLCSGILLLRITDNVGLIMCMRRSADFVSAEVNIQQARNLTGGFRP